MIFLLFVVCIHVCVCEWEELNFIEPIVLRVMVEGGVDGGERLEVSTLLSDKMAAFEQISHILHTDTKNLLLQTRQPTSYNLFCRRPYNKLKIPRA